MEANTKDPTATAALFAPPVATKPVPTFAPVSEESADPAETKDAANSGNTETKAPAAKPKPAEKKTTKKAAKKKVDKKNASKKTSAKKSASGDKKFCPRCKKTKSVDDFPQSNGKPKFACKPCWKDYMSEKYYKKTGKKKIAKKAGKKKIAKKAAAKKVIKKKVSTKKAKKTIGKKTTAKKKKKTSKKTGKKKVAKKIPTKRKVKAKANRVSKKTRVARGTILNGAVDNAKSKIVDLQHRHKLIAKEIKAAERHLTAVTKLSAKAKKLGL